MSTESIKLESGWQKRGPKALEVCAGEKTGRVGFGGWHVERAGLFFFRRTSGRGEKLLSKIRGRDGRSDMRIGLEKALYNRSQKCQT